MKHHNKYQICVAGAARGESVKEGKELAEGLGKAIAQYNSVTFTGATIGLSYFASKAAQQAGGQTVGISPATSRHEHVHKYRLPTDVFDLLIYTGLDYVGRDLMLVQTSDACIVVGGRIGTLHEFTSALEAHKPVGVLMGAGGTSAEIDDILKAAEKSRRHIVFDDDPDKIVEKIVEILDEKHADHDEYEREYTFKKVGKKRKTMPVKE